MPFRKAAAGYFISTQNDKLQEIDPDEIYTPFYFHHSRRTGILPGVQ
jgi:hypothetical protein